LSQDLKEKNLSKEIPFKHNVNKINL